MLARDEHPAPHPAIEEISHAKAIGHADAEDLLRGQARRGDKGAQAALQEIDQARSARIKAVIEENDHCAKELGLTMNQVQALVAKLTSNPHLLSWLQSRVNWTHCHGRALRHDE